ncbi:MAG: hypothetical protein D8M54_16455 [Chloroflexi bacterium]|nr:hypothetical protein [Chloroflexota bacterium]
MVTTMMPMVLLQTTCYLPLTTCPTFAHRYPIEYNFIYLAHVLGVILKIGLIRQIEPIPP